MTILERVLRIPPAETTFQQRGFVMPVEPVRRRLEKVGEAFRAGYHAALPDKELGLLPVHLDRVAAEFRGFAYEGAAMALDILDQFKPWTQSRFQRFLTGFASHHTYMMHVGLGWSLARWPFRRERRLDQLDPLLRWLALDGFGFHEGYFHWQRYADGKRIPSWLQGYQRRVFDQGLGRSVWFVAGADPKTIHSMLSSFLLARHGDLWSGIGLACAYAGGAEADQMDCLRRLAGECSSHLAQGAAFAARARERAGITTPHSEAACRVLCRMPAHEAAGITEDALPAQVDRDGAYESWRNRIRSRFLASRPHDSCNEQARSSLPA
jgi:enediyne biosynthesis protein E3